MDLTNRYERKSPQWAWVGQQEDLQVLVSKMREMTAVAAGHVLDGLTARLTAEETRERESEAELEAMKAAGERVHSGPWTSYEKPGILSGIAAQKTKMLGRATWNRGSDKTEGDALGVIATIDPGVTGTLTLQIWEDASSYKPTIEVVFTGKYDGMPGAETTVRHSDLIAGSGLTDRMNRALSLQRPWWASLRTDKGRVIRYVLALVAGLLLFAPTLRLLGKPFGSFMLPVLASIPAYAFVTSRISKWLFPAFVIEDRVGRSSNRVAWSIVVISVAPLLSFGILFLLPPP